MAFQVADKRRYLSVCMSIINIIICFGLCDKSYPHLIISTINIWSEAANKWRQFITRRLLQVNCEHNARKAFINHLGYFLYQELVFLTLRHR